MDPAQPAVALRPVAAGDLEFLEREVVDRDVRGHANWWGFGHAGSVRRQFETDGFLGQDGGRLIAEVGCQWPSWRHHWWPWWYPPVAIESPHPGDAFEVPPSSRASTPG
jgi:hypothetical protein